MELIRIYVELANPLTKHTLLVIGQIQDVFNTSRNKSSNLVLNPYKSVQEKSKEMLFIKTRQIIYRDLMFNSRQFSTKAVSIKNYEIQISKSIFHAYPSYLCRISFLTTLDIIRIILRAVIRLLHLLLQAYCDRRQFALVYLSFEEVAAFVHRRVL